MAWLFVGLALIPIPVGLAKLLFHKLATRRSAAGSDANPPTPPG